MKRLLSVPVDKAVLLLVDDMPSIRALTRAILREYGFKNFVECGSGAEAAKRLEGSSVDLIICDYEMPEPNGLELLKMARAKDELKDVPFIMLTGDSSPELVNECITAGVDDYIVKPFQPDSLCAKINKVIAPQAEASKSA